jgi:hypothetical protein
MAEMIELGRIPFAGKRSELEYSLPRSPQPYFYKLKDTFLTVLEIGASTSFPSLLASVSDDPPESILTTDYPDEALIK